MTRVAALVLLASCFITSVDLQAEDLPEPGWENLLQRDDPNKSVAGQWSKSGDGLSVAASPGARMLLPYRPNGEYDFRVTFTRQSGINSIALIFVAGSGQATFEIDGWGQHLSGIQQIGGRDMRSYSENVKRVTLQNGRRYTALIEVRKDAVSVYLDDQLLQKHRTNGSDLSMVNLWQVPDRASLGLAAWESETIFHQIEVRPVSAPAAIVARPRTPAASANSTTKTAPTGSRPGGRSVASDELAQLSDEFDDEATLRNWLQVFEVEQTGADQLERIDIGQSRAGWMTLVPYTSSWYQDWRGVLVHKRVRGDFIVTTRVHTTGRSGDRAPARLYSLAGIMVRTPRNVTPQTWRPGGENYIFLSHGTARNPGNYEFEVKTTVNSNSNLEVTSAEVPESLIRVVRIGAHFVLLRRSVGEDKWIVHRRYLRPDMPVELQVGMTVYTDWPNMERIPPEQHNRMVIRNGQPDLIAHFDYFRFQRPTIPERLQGRAFSDPAQVSDEEILVMLTAAE